MSQLFIAQVPRNVLFSGYDNETQTNNGIILGSRNKAYSKLFNINGDDNFTTNDGSKTINGSNNALYGSALLSGNFNSISGNILFINGTSNNISGNNISTIGNNNLSSSYFINKDLHINGNDNTVSGEFLYIIGSNNITVDTKYNYILGNNNTIQGGYIAPDLSGFTDSSTSSVTPTYSNNDNIYILGSNNIVGTYSNVLYILGQDNTIGQNVTNVNVFGSNTIVKDDTYNITILNGSNNIVGTYSNNLTIKGDNNTIGTSVSNVNVYGNNANITNSSNNFVIGDNITLTNSNSSLTVGLESSFVGTASFDGPVVFNGPVYGLTTSAYTPYYGNFYNSASQSFPAGVSTYSIYNNTVNSNGIYLTASRNIYIENTGVYYIEAGFYPYMTSATNMESLFSVIDIYVNNILLPGSERIVTTTDGTGVINNMYRELTTYYIAELNSGDILNIRVYNRSDYPAGDIYAIDRARLIIMSA